MNKTKILLLLLISTLASSCITFEEPEPKSSFKPIYLKRSIFENSIQFETAKPTVNSGKIYIKEQLMFINDINKGFQVYNYANPTNPVAIGYIKIPGATDVAVRNNILYINQATDLVSINYNLFSNTITVTNRIKNAFPPKVSPDGFTAYEKENQVVIDWTN
jgi:hypothetical protein